MRGGGGWGLLGGVEGRERGQGGGEGERSGWRGGREVRVAGEE